MALKKSDLCSSLRKSCDELGEEAAAMRMCTGYDAAGRLGRLTSDIATVVEQERAKQ